MLEQNVYLIDSPKNIVLIRIISLSKDTITAPLCCLTKYYSVDLDYQFTTYVALTSYE